mmetsp:Transcript_44844/g.113012  ORF Transcript_44844/g.113012 Transcript_44844/m.113012 type:complete len:377 (-) Transcript_44844:123-1253(-)|eukprot:CAMPEP_0177639620 /NCGR_PEP_ID=MMETSP0447-20121125/6117_1 /TAXON_ID=0 /ORGANISM="Stygamoeba regulata, Strain BSH-02190019" /LENGTH=376 /DNA_ID=CAMNT_0019141657 /DNA_START=53 /DNA_END=1183 /DNA_ORIENTATION=+
MTNQTVKQAPTNNVNIDASSDQGDTNAYINFVSKRLRATRKKLQKVAQIEEKRNQGLKINKEQQEILSTKDLLQKICKDYEELIEQMKELFVSKKKDEETKKVDEEQKISLAPIAALMLAARLEQPTSLQAFQQVLLQSTSISDVETHLECFLAASNSTAFSNTSYNQLHAAALGVKLPPAAEESAMVALPEEPAVEPLKVMAEEVPEVEPSSPDAEPGTIPEVLPTATETECQDSEAVSCDEAPKDDFGNRAAETPAASRRGGRGRGSRGMRRGRAQGSPLNGEAGERPAGRPFRARNGNEENREPGKLEPKEDRDMSGRGRASGRARGRGAPRRPSQRVGRGKGDVVPPANSIRAGKGTGLRQVGTADQAVAAV